MTMDEALKIKTLHDKIKAAENCGEAIEAHFKTLKRAVPESQLYALADLASTAQTIKTDYLHQLRQDLASIRIYGAQP